MKTVRVSIKDFREAIQTGVSDADLEERFRLSPKSLRKIKRTLLSSGYLTADALRRQGTPIPPVRKRVLACEFLEEFRFRPDDYYLMERFGLRPNHLKQVYEQLLAKDLLSEYEFHARERKAPKLTDRPESDLSPDTLVTLLREEGELLPDLATGRQYEPGEMPASFYRDVTAGLRPTGAPEGAERELSELRAATSTVVEVLTTEICPRCAHPRSGLLEESCSKCGIVFARYKG